MKNKYLRKLNIELVDGEFKNPIQEQVKDPRQVYEVFNAIKNKAQETLIALYLWEDLRCVYSVLSIGDAHSTAFDPKEIFGQAYVARAKYLILIHNHPKGDPTPSQTDYEAIMQLSQQSQIMDIAFLDFIIVGQGSYWSFFDEQQGGSYTLGSVEL